MTCSDEDFKWRDDECVVVADQQAVAVYVNASGGITIRQEADWPHQEEDTIIVIQPQNAQRVCDAIMSAAAEIGPALDLAVRHIPSAPPSAPLTNAERQRRFRNRRNGNKENHADPVTPRNDDRNDTDQLLLTSGQAVQHE